MLTEEMLTKRLKELNATKERMMAQVNMVLGQILEVQIQLQAMKNTVTAIDPKVVPQELA